MALEECLGDFTWLLDMMLEPCPAASRSLAARFAGWRNMNWKFGAENSGGDTYHGATTHASARGVGHKVRRTPPEYNESSARHVGLYDGRRP